MLRHNKGQYQDTVTQDNFNFQDYFKISEISGQLGPLCLLIWSQPAEFQIWSLCGQ